MLLTIVIAALAACGVLMILLTLKEAFLPRPSCACHLIYLKSGRPDPAAQVQACLWRRRCGSLTGRLIFVDRGLAPQEQAAIALLLRRAEDAVLCSPAQAAEYTEMRSNELGAGTDQRNHRGGRV